MQPMAVLQQYPTLYREQLLPDEQSIEPLEMIEQLLHVPNLRQNWLLMWQTPPTVLLGLVDQRLGNLALGQQYLDKKGYQVIVRQLGGLAVISDPGILNVTWVLPGYFELEAGFQFAALVIRHALAKLPIEIHEVADSYCPGRFDLTIKGAKIGGLAQRRSRGNTAMSAYLAVNGNQYHRGMIIQHFYQVANTKSDWQHYPQVNPNSMTTLQVQLAQPVTVCQVVADFKSSVADWLPSPLCE